MTQLCEQYEGFRQYALSTGKYVVAQEYREALENIKDAFKGLAIELENNKDLKEKIDSDRSVKNMRTFFKILREEYTQPLAMAA